MQIRIKLTSGPGSPRGPFAPGGPTGPGGPLSPGDPGVPGLPGGPFKRFTDLQFKYIIIYK